MCHSYIESATASKILEDEGIRNRVQRCRLLTSFQEDPHQILFFHEKMLHFNSPRRLANWIIASIFLVSLTSSYQLIIIRNGDCPRFSAMGNTLHSFNSTVS